MHLLECGLLGGPFHPAGGDQGGAGRAPLPHQSGAGQRVSEIARLGKVLQESAGIKIDSVACSITATQSGRAMIEALIDGERRGPVLAQLAKGRMRAAKIADLSMALEGRFSEHHALMCRLHLDHIDHLEAMTPAGRPGRGVMTGPFKPAAGGGPAGHRPRDRPRARRRRG